MPGNRMFREKLRLVLVWTGLLALFGFSAGCLPKLLPESLRVIASTQAWLSWLAMAFVLAALRGIGPLAKKLNAAAIEHDGQERAQYRVRRPWE